MIMSIIIFLVMISKNDYIHYNLFGYNIKKFILAKEVIEFEKKCYEIYFIEWFCFMMGGTKSIIFKNKGPWPTYKKPYVFYHLTRNNIGRHRSE